MKKLLFFIGIALSLSIANGQGFTYQPFIYKPSQGSSQNQNSNNGYNNTPNHSQGDYQNSSNESSPSIRTTAYRVHNGQVYKMPIKVQRQQSYGTSAYYVIERYVDTGFGGKWETIHNSPKVQNCNSHFAGNNWLEEQYMYKAYISLNWYYFDL